MYSIFIHSSNTYGGLVLKIMNFPIFRFCNEFSEFFMIFEYFLCFPHIFIFFRKGQFITCPHHTTYKPGWFQLARLVGQDGLTGQGLSSPKKLTRKTNFICHFEMFERGMGRSETETGWRTSTEYKPVVSC